MDRYRFMRQVRGVARPARGTREGYTSFVRDISVRWAREYLKRATSRPAFVNAHADRMARFAKGDM